MGTKHHHSQGFQFEVGRFDAQEALDSKVPNYKLVDKTDAKAMALLNRATQTVGVFEGAGYQSKGCYRPAQECRMKINEVEDFCPVCTRAIRRITDFYTTTWDIKK